MVVPYKEKNTSKKEQVAEMFDNISPKYDFLNHFLSVGIDIYWRKRAIQWLKAERPKTILDVATGTCDFALEAMILKPEKVVGVDISEGMLAEGQKKIDRRNLGHVISLELGDSENLNFADNSFEAVIVSFGVRNFENLEKGLENIYRVLAPNGTLIVLEFSQPTATPFKQFYNAYSNYLLPQIGKFFSKDSSAYTYLPESVKAFPSGADFLQILQQIGFQNTICEPLTWGISSIYKAKKIVI